MNNKENKRTHAEYITDTFDGVQFRVRKGKRELIQQAAKKEGLSVNAWLNNLIDRELEK